MRMPISKPGGARFRGPTSSQEYNQHIDDAYSDLLELYKQSNDHLMGLQKAHQVVLIENATLHRYVEMLETRIQTLETQLQDFETHYPLLNEYFKTSFVDHMQTNFPNAAQINATPAEIDFDHRFVTLPILSEIPKTHTINEMTGQVFIPKELQIKTGRSNTGGEVIEGDVYQAFNGNNESYWVRKVIYDQAACPAEEDVSIEIELPLHMVNNLNVNHISIHPHPERGIEIRNIEVQFNNSWKQISGFQQETLSAVSEEYSPRKKWYFTSLPIQRVRITLVQKHPFDLNGKKVFVLGAQEIGIDLVLFEQEGGVVLTPVDMSEVGIYDIESIEHIFMNRSAFSLDNQWEQKLEGNLFEYEILKEEIDGMLTPLSSHEWSQQIAPKLWVKTRLLPDPNNGVNPCLHAIRLHYSKST